MRSDFTLTYGLGYQLETPPYEVDGKQVLVVDQGGNPIRTEDYLAARKSAALAGQVYNPTLGFATIRNVSGGRKYPYDPFYGGFRPHRPSPPSPPLRAAELLIFLRPEKNQASRGWAHFLRERKR